jgi:hypothetical protein
MKGVNWIVTLSHGGSCVLGCMKVDKDPNDNTPPDVVIKVKGADGQYTVASSAKLNASASDKLDLGCVVSDANGVQSASISYADSLDGCTIESEVWECVASYQPEPQGQFQKLDGDANGQVLTEWLLLATVKGGFTCACPGVGGVGVPYGRTLAVTCTGTNWSSDLAKQSTSKVLTIDLQ